MEEWEGNKLNWCLSFETIDNGRGINKSFDSVSCRCKAKDTTNVYELPVLA